MNSKEIANTIGYKSIVILFDKIDEYPEINANVDKIVDFVKDILLCRRHAGRSKCLCREWEYEHCAKNPTATDFRLRAGFFPNMRLRR